MISNFVDTIKENEVEIVGFVLALITVLSIMFLQNKFNIHPSEWGAMPGVMRI